MNITEERLRAAAREAARVFPAAGDLPPLRLPETSGRRRHSVRGAMSDLTRNRMWLAPVAAATAVAAVAVAAVFVAPGTRSGHGGQPARVSLPGGQPASKPPYFLGLYTSPGNDLFSNLAVYDAASGAVVTDLAPRTHGLTFTAVAATASSTEFVAAAEPASGGHIGCGATIYQVKLTTAGRLVSLAPLPGAPRPGYVSGIEVSADGSTLAIESAPCYVQGQGSTPDQIELLSAARTRRWKPAGPTIIPELGSLSFDGSSLAFSNFIGEGTEHGSNDGAARIVRSRARSGSLTNAARVVVAHGSRATGAGVESAALSPDGRILYACSRQAVKEGRSRYSLALAAYRVASGRKIRVLGSWPSDEGPCQLAIAASGDYALITGIFAAPRPYAYRVNLSTGQATPVGKAPAPGRRTGDTDPYIIAW
jgi:hypothetical protein